MAYVRGVEDMDIAGNYVGSQKHIGMVNAYAAGECQDVGAHKKGQRLAGQ